MWETGCFSEAVFTRGVTFPAPIKSCLSLVPWSSPKKCSCFFNKSVFASLLQEGKLLCILFTALLAQQQQVTCVGRELSKWKGSSLTWDVSDASFRRSWVWQGHIFWRGVSALGAPWSCSRLLCGAIRISVSTSDELSSGTWLLAEWCQHGHWFQCESQRSENTFEGSTGANYRNTDGLQETRLC